MILIELTTIISGMIVACPGCRGTGEMTDFNCDYIGQRRYRYYTEHKCDICDGKRLVKIKLEKLDEDK